MGDPNCEGQYLQVYLVHRSKAMASAESLLEEKVTFWCHLLFFVGYLGLFRPLVQKSAIIQWQSSNSPTRAMIEGDGE